VSEDDAGVSREGAFLEGAGSGGSDDWCASCRRFLEGQRSRLVIPPDTGRASLAVAPLVYDGQVRRWILRVKVGRDVALGGALGAWLARRVACRLGPARPRGARGFDPTDRIASEVARALGVSTRRVLERRARGPAQKRAGRASRRLANATGSFAVCRGMKLECGAVLLVDDVITTGNTVRACARALRHAGASTVFVAVLAVTPLDVAPREG